MEEKKENRRVGLGIKRRSLYQLIAADPSWVVDCVQVRVWTVDTLGGGRCIFASTLQALHPENKYGRDKDTLRSIDAERSRARVHAEASLSAQALGR